MSLKPAPAALAVGIFCIGWSAIFVRLAQVPGLTSAFYRTFFTAVVLVVWWLIRPPARGMDARRRWATAIGGIFFALDLALWNVAILKTSATTATLLANNAPIWVGLITVFFLRQPLSVAFWAGIAVALLGTALVTGPDALASAELGRGHLMAIGAGFFYAVYLIITNRVRATADTRVFMTVSVVAAAALLFVIALVGGAPLTGFPLRSWAALLGLGLVSHLGGWLAINYALGHLPTPLVSVGLLGQVLVTGVLSALLLGESLSTLKIAGGVLVLLGIYIVTRRGR